MNMNELIKKAQETIRKADNGEPCGLEYDDVQDYMTVRIMQMVMEEPETVRELALKDRIVAETLQFLADPYQY